MERAQGTHQTPPNTRWFKKAERIESSAPGRPRVVICEYRMKGDKACSSGEFVENSLCRRARKVRKAVRLNEKQLFWLWPPNLRRRFAHRPGYLQRHGKILFTPIILRNEILLRGKETDDNPYANKFQNIAIPNNHLCLWNMCDIDLDPTIY